MSSNPSPADRDRAKDHRLSDPARGGENWPDTDHPALGTLRNGSPAEKEAALRRLFSSYSQPLRSHIRHHWPLLSDSDIDDLASEFMTLCLTGDKAHFLTYNPDRAGAPTRLRTYLHTILDNFLRNHRRSTRAQIRGGNRHHESLNTIRPAAHQETPADGTGPSPNADLEAFDRHWAQHIISISFLSLDKGSPANREWLAILRPWILADPGDASLKEIAASKNCTHDSVRAQLHRLRKAWRQAVRDAVARTVAHPDEIDDELRHLAAVLGRHPVE
jgi:RNA polymerase sigma-70 factor (ECF subfamily)